jgi:hypothetical protein
VIGEARKRRRRRAEARGLVGAGQRVDRYILGGPNTFSSNRIESKNFINKTRDFFSGLMQDGRAGLGLEMCGPAGCCRLFPSSFLKASS